MPDDQTPAHQSGEASLFDDEARHVMAALIEWVIAERALEDADALREWIVEVVDPELPPEDPWHRRFIGPFADERDALMEVDRLERLVNPALTADGSRPLRAAIRGLEAPTPA